MTDSKYVITILCSGEFRELPRAEWDALEGPKPSDPQLFVCNGCTMSPDEIRGKRAWPACVIHDYQYNKTSLSRKACDDIFRSNLRASLEMDGMNSLLARGFAWAYYRVVRWRGRAFYNGTGSPE